MKRLAPWLAALVVLGLTYSSNLARAADAATNNAPGTAAVTNASPIQTTDNVEFTIGPVYVDPPELRVLPDVPRGTLHDLTFNSTNTQTYPGIARNQPGAVVPYQRKVCVYVPKQYVPGTPAPFIVAHDGLGYRGTLPKVLDNLINEHRLPVMIAIMINSGGGDGPGSERGLEYDTVSDKYTMFIENELLPQIEQQCQVTLTKDPAGRATMGGSSGGAAAFTMAWFHPELYHRVLTYSGTYVNQHQSADAPHGAWGYHEKFIPESDPKPLRVWLEVSEHDNGVDRDEASMHNWLIANQHMASALKAKGYQYRYVYALGARHTDGRVTRQTLPWALEWLWADYK